MTDTRQARPALAGSWTDGNLPDNVVLGPGTVITGEHAFRRLITNRRPGLVVGRDCALDQVQFSYGFDGYIEIGDCCVCSSAIFMSELENIPLPPAWTL